MKNLYVMRVLEAIEVSSLYRNLHDLRMVGSLFQSSSPREKEKKREHSHKASMGTLSFGCSLPIDRHLVCGFFIITLIIMSISRKIYRLYLCDLIACTFNLNSYHI